jgi:hypothetical protein
MQWARKQQFHARARQIIWKICGLFETKIPVPASTLHGKGFGQTQGTGARRKERALVAMSLSTAALVVSFSMALVLL